MMKKNKLILLQIFVAFTLICSSVYAAVNTTIAVKASKNSVLRGEKVSVTLSLENVDNEKVEEVEGYVNYDSNIVEPITFESIQKDAENKVKIGNEVLVVEDVTKGNLSASSGYIGFNSDPSSGNDTRFVIEFNDGITEDVDLMTIDFVVKEDATLGEIKNAITYSTFVVTADAETSEEITKNVTLTVKAENAPADDDSNENKNENKNSNTNSNENKNENKNTNSNTNTNTNSKNENKNTNKNTNTNTNQNKNTNKAGNTNTNTKDNTVSGTNLPATGAKMIIIPAIVLLVLAYVSYNKYMKYKNV